MSVTRIHPDIASVPRMVHADETLRRVYWNSSKDYYRSAKQVRRAGQPGLASEILASGRQAISIATAPDAMAMVRWLTKDERAAVASRIGFRDHCYGTAIDCAPPALRCPFCDDLAVTVVEACGPEDENGPSYYAECGKCAAQGPSGSTQLAAAERWNRRSSREAQA